MLLHDQSGLDLAPRRPVSVNTLTDEQRAIVAHDPSTTLIVTAYAGVGKTSTLIEIARAWPRKRGLYLAFNKAIADDANRKFAGTKVTAKTSHGYAFGMLGISSTPTASGPRSGGSTSATPSSSWSTATWRWT